MGWGQTGHRVIGQIAEWHLNDKAASRIENILGPESLAMVANWMDEVRSDRRYDHLNTCHYLSVEENGNYNPEIQEKDGDAFVKTKDIIQALKSGQLDPESELEYLKMLVHLVGDLHQPLHVGKGDDRGGNDIKVTFFDQNTNLHSVWDSKVIDGKNLSYTELSTHLNRRATKQLVFSLQSASMEDWLQEAVALRPVIYDLPKNGRLSYEFVYKTYPVIEERLLVGGIRLAGILNDIYG
jgi:hypothetical protein